MSNVDYNNGAGAAGRGEHPPKNASPAWMNGWKSKK